MSAEEEVTASLAEATLEEPDEAEEDVDAEPEEGETNGTDKPPAAVSDQKVIAKFLMSNAAAGSIIGKGGSNISEFQTQSSARIQLSRANEYFPGSQDRIMLISGTVNQVLTALHLVLAKMKGEKSVAESMLSRDGKSTQLRMLVPAALCGTIIGKGGATIRSFAEDSKANITVSPQDRQPPGVADRVVRITGADLEQLMRAVALIITKLSENPNYSRFTTNSVSYGFFGGQQGGYGYGGAPQGGYGSRGAYQRGAPAAPVPEGEQVEVTVPVPEARVGAVIGKGGEVITQLKSVVGVRIRISDKEDFIPGTRDRKVTINGSPEAVQIAQALINQKVTAPDTRPV